MDISQGNEVQRLGATIRAAAEKACGNSMALKIPKDIHYPTARTGLFASLQSSRGHKSLVKVMYKLGKAYTDENVDNAISSYLGTRWYGMLVFVASIVTFLIGIYLMCTVSTKVREFSNRICCCRKKSSRSAGAVAGANVHRENDGIPTANDVEKDSYSDDTRYLRSMLTQLSKRIRLSLLALCIVCFCALMLVTGFAINSAIDMNESKQIIDCNMWMELSGYFNGARELQPEAVKFAKLQAQTRSDTLGYSSRGSDLSYPRLSQPRASRRSLLRASPSDDLLFGREEDSLVMKDFTATENDGRSYMGVSDYGDSGIVRGEDLIGRITTNWLGAAGISERLDELGVMTALDDTNEVHRNFTEGRESLEVDLKAKNARIDELLEVVDQLIKRYADVNTSMRTLMQSKATSIGRWTGDYSFVFALQKVYTSKAHLFRDELNKALALSFTAMDSLIEKYAGHTSALMKKANSAVLQTKDTIQQINEAIRALYEVWDKHNHLLTVLVVLIITFLAIYLLSAFIASLLAVYLSVNLVRHPALTDGPSYNGGKAGGQWSNAKSDPARSPGVQKEKSSGTFYAGARHIWRLAFAICALAFGCSAFTTGLTYLVSLVGSDSCQVANIDLLDNGDWDLLGRNVIYPNGPPGDDAGAGQTAVVDMKKVLDVCLKRSGQGTIGVTLGLDQPISEMNDDVASAISVIKATRDQLLLRDSRTQRVRIVGFMMKELLRGWIHADHFHVGSKMGVGERTPAFNGFMDINWENHNAETGGRRVILGFVSDWPKLLEPLTKHGIFFQIGSLADAYNLLNDVSDAVYAKDPTTKFPRFCGVTAVNRQLPCSKYSQPTRRMLTPGDENENSDQDSSTWALAQAADSREVVNLSDDKKVTSAQIAAWVGFDEVSKTFKFDQVLPTFGEYYSDIGSRVYQLISALAFVEQTAQLPLNKLGLTAPANLTCTDSISNATRDCVFDDVRLHDIQTVEKEMWPPVLETYESILASVDEYVDGLVIPSSKAIVEKANDLINSTNCQFQRGVLDYGVVTPLCANVFPAIAELSVLSFVAFVVIGILLFLLWAYRPLFDEEPEVLEAYYNRIGEDARFAREDVVAPSETQPLSRGITAGSQAARLNSKPNTVRYQNLRDVSTAPNPSEHESVAVARQLSPDTQSNNRRTTAVISPPTRQISGSSAYVTEHDGLYPPASRKDTAAGSYESINPHMVR